MSEPPVIFRAQSYRCPACGGAVSIIPLEGVADAPCPHCRCLLWFLRRTVEGVEVITFLPGLITGSESLERLDEVLSAVGDPPRAVLDLSQLRMISSIFLATLVRVHQRVTAAKGSVAICGVDEVGMQAIRATRLDMLLSVFPSEPDALASCR